MHCPILPPPPPPSLSGAWKMHTPSYLYENVWKKICFLLLMAILVVVTRIRALSILDFLKQKMSQHLEFLWLLKIKCASASSLICHLSFLVFFPPIVEKQNKTRKTVASPVVKTHLFSLSLSFSVSPMGVTDRPFSSHVQDSRKKALLSTTRPAFQE